MIKIINTSENNLKNISIDIPLHKITSIIGVSGSGKSTLIYNVLANEAKRQEKIDSGNANCFDYSIRSNFEKIENLPYCITLKQRGLFQSISSTLATITNLHELIREEFVKYGEIIGDNGNVIKKPNSTEIREFINKYYPKEKFEYFAITIFNKYTDGKKELKILNSNSIKNAIFISSFDDEERLKNVSSIKSLNNKYKHTILVPINKITDIENYENMAIESFLIRNKSISFNFGIDYPDLITGKIYQKKSTQLLSFNATSLLGGKCNDCNGHGLIDYVDFESLILKDKNLNENFLNLEDNGKGAYKYVNIRHKTIQKILLKEKVDLNQSYYNLKKEYQELIKDEISLKMLHHQGKPSIAKFVKNIVCPTCKGTRLNYKANAIKLFGVNISEILDYSVDELLSFLNEKKLHHKKILSILKALQESTLGYLTLNRTTDTLSGGELQRLKFSLELNSEYKNLLYILDEPSTGLHSYNNFQMINLIKMLRDKGNTIVISEHNEDYIKNSDYILKLGPGSGDEGGQVILKGNSKEFKNINFARKKLTINIENSIELKCVNFNNIINQDFIIPLNCLVSITGISGSGKSSLIHKVLVPTLKQYLADKTYDKSIIKNVNGFERIHSLVELTQSQIGINSRSIVATYLNIFDKIRNIYASLDISKQYDFDKSYFSFNSNEGACENCKGMGEIEEVTCPTCLGQRYKIEVLDIKYNGLNIIELLNIQINKLKNIFEDDMLYFTFETLEKLGLSHLSLGRSTPTLSGGEAQRLKLAKTLIESFHKIKKGNFLFVLDEPTSGLSEKDSMKIYDIFDEILVYKNSIIVIEHNLNIIKNSDFIIDIGIGSSSQGGKNIFSGSFERLLENKESLTAKAFNKDFKKIKDIDFSSIVLSEKNYNKKDNNHNINKFYLDDMHFSIEKDFSENYNVITDNQNHIYFRRKEELFEFIKKLDNIEVFFNPYVTYLYKYEIIPNSIKKEKIKHLKKLGFKVNTKDFEIEEWDYRVKCDSLEKAYNYGSGWITIKNDGKTYELFTRLVSLKEKIIGTPKIGEKTFNLYLNKCIYCDSGYLHDIFDLNIIIANKEKSIIDNGFFHSNINLNLKNIILKFQKENLFDFTKPFNQLTTREQNIFLYGFREYSFLKPNGRKNAIGDYIKWEGIYTYIKQNLKKIKIANEIQSSSHNIKCPFCEKGFKKEVKFYKYKNNTILDYL